MPKPLVAQRSETYYLLAQQVTALAVRIDDGQEVPPLVKVFTDARFKLQTACLPSLAVGQ